MDPKMQEKLSEIINNNCSSIFYSTEKESTKVKAVKILRLLSDIIKNEAFGPFKNIDSF